MGWAEFGCVKQCWGMCGTLLDIALPALRRQVAHLAIKACLALQCSQALGYNALMVPLAAGVFFPLTHMQVGARSASRLCAQQQRGTAALHKQQCATAALLDSSHPQRPLFARLPRLPCSCRPGRRARAWRCPPCQWCALPCCCAVTASPRLCCASSPSWSAELRARAPLRPRARAASTPCCGGAQHPNSFVDHCKHFQLCDSALPNLHVLCKLPLLRG